MYAYHNANIQMTSYCKWHQALKVKMLAVMARLLGIQFHIEGLPFGAPKKREKGANGRVVSLSDPNSAE